MLPLSKTCCVYHEKILFVYFLLCPILVFSQARVKFNRYSTPEGLSQEYIFCMLQDKNGFMWFGTEDGLNRFDGYKFKVYKNNHSDTSSISYDNISAIHEDNEKKLWVGTFRGDINRFDPKTEKFTRFKINREAFTISSFKKITTIVKDQQGTVWAGTIGTGLYCLKPGQKSFSLFNYFPDDPENMSIHALALDKSGILWIGTQKGLYSYNSSNKKLTRYINKSSDNKSIINNLIYSIFISRNGEMYIGTDRGIDKFDAAHRSFIHLKGSSQDKMTLTLDSVSVRAIQEDMENYLWLGTPEKLIKFNPSTNLFQTFYHRETDLQSISGNNILCIGLDKEGGVWIGTRSGVNRYDRKLHQFSHYRMEPDNPRTLPFDAVWDIQEDQQGIVWVSGVPFDLNRGVIPESELDPILVKEIIKPKRRFLLEDKQGRILASAEDGLYCIHRKTGQVDHYMHSPLDSNSLGNNKVFYAFGAPDGKVWLKVRNGLSIFDPHKKRFENYYLSNDPNGLGASVINHHLQDYLGNIWLGTRSGGLMLFDDKNKTFKHLRHNPEDSTSISDDVNHGIYEDKARRLWFSTANGLDLYDRKSNRFIHFQDKYGLTDNLIFGIKEDKRGRLWLSTNNQIFCFNPKDTSFRSYNKHDGVEGGGFYDGAYHQSPLTGLIFFGAMGLVVFHPDSIRDDTYIPPVAISRFQYLVRGKGGAVLTEEKGILEKASITLTHQQKTLLLFEFSSLSFSKPRKNQYKYQLKGYSGDWILLGTRREVSFTNLAPGSYTLRVQGSNGDGVWNETPTELKIRILPPWYWSWWAKGIYLILTIGSIYYIYQFQLKRQLALAEVLRLQELNQVKTRLYTNITHEFRTPLTIMLGMADKIEQAPRQWLKEGVSMIKRNGQNLLRLVNQMLDLARLESGSLPVNMVQGNIIVHLSTILELFRSYAESKNIELHFASDVPQVVMDYDPDKIKDIVSNLLSNALKFTPSGGVVKFEVRNPFSEASNVFRASYLEFQVIDTGEGIPSEKLPYIFERFYLGDDSTTRRSSGTGIGLALTQELVKLLGGEITVSSEYGQGALFNVRLPISNKAPLVEHILEEERMMPEVQTPLLAVNRHRDLPLALIVEDNTEVMTYLSTCLQDQYRLEVAYNGQQGIDMSIELVPDVIISDVMMPVKDGFELCQTLKNDIRTSHIPIVLLTARADMDSRLEGLEGGADVYLTKPFSEQELEISLRKSLELRARLQERYATGSTPKESTKTIYGKDDIFIKNLHELLEKQYENESFTIPEVAKGVGMSETQLRRKVHALLNTTPQLYLRQFRLKKAYHLIKMTDLSIREIAMATGFNDPAYFSNIFLEEFGERPSDFR